MFNPINMCVYVCELECVLHKIEAVHKKSQTKWTIKSKSNNNLQIFILLAITKHKTHS